LIQALTEPRSCDVERPDAAQRVGADIIVPGEGRSCALAAVTETPVWPLHSSCRHASSIVIKSMHYTAVLVEAVVEYIEELGVSSLKMAKGRVGDQIR
jgi:hypothetical protein